MSLPTKPFKWVANFTQVPNEFFEIGPYLTEPELRIMLYAIRHTIGWIEKKDSREANISVRNFANGYTLEGETYEGTHLTEVTIRKALIELVKLGLLEKVGGVTEIGQRWKLPQGCDVQALAKREQDRFAADQKRTVNGRKKAEEKRKGVTGGLSDNGGYPTDENGGYPITGGGVISYPQVVNTKNNIKERKELLASALRDANAQAPSPVTVSLEGEEKSAHAEYSTEGQRKPQTATTPPIPNSAAPLTPAEKPLTPQQARVKALGEAFGIEAVGKDGGKYSKVAAALIEATIPCEEFKQYVTWVRREAKKSGDWTVTINSLSEGSRPSAYVAARNAYNAQGRDKTGFQVYSDVNPSRRGYNRQSDPAYALSKESQS